MLCVCSSFFCTEMGIELTCADVCCELRDLELDREQRRREKEETYVGREAEEDSKRSRKRY